MCLGDSSAAHPWQRSESVKTSAVFGNYYVASIQKWLWTTCACWRMLHQLKCFESYSPTCSFQHSGHSEKNVAYRKGRFLRQSGMLWCCLMFVPRITGIDGRVMEHEPYVWIHRSSCFWHILVLSLAFGNVCRLHCGSWRLLLAKTMQQFLGVSSSLLECCCICCDETRSNLYHDAISYAMNKYVFFPSRLPLSRPALFPSACKPTRIGHRLNM